MKEDFNSVLMFFFSRVDTMGERFAGCPVSIYVVSFVLFQGRYIYGSLCGVPSKYCSRISTVTHKRCLLYCYIVMAITYSCNSLLYDTILDTAFQFLDIGTCGFTLDSQRKPPQYPCSIIFPQILRIMQYFLMSFQEFGFGVKQHSFVRIVQSVTDDGVLHY